MPTLTDVIGSIAGYLREMGYIAYGLKISSFDAASEQGVWAVHGTFQNGFMGEYCEFEAVYEPDTGSARKINISEIPARPSYA